MSHISLCEPPSLTIVVPCYNEGKIFEICLTKLRKILQQEILAAHIKADSVILFVDDGSTDDTWDQIEKAGNKYPLVRGIKLSRNRGHQIALWAGLHHIKTDVAISIDADLQDDINAIPAMIAGYRTGSQIVYGVRSERSSDTFFKRTTAALYYKLLSLLGAELIPQHADFRLLGPKALAAIKTYPLRNLYLRGIIPQLGFKSSKVFYKRQPREAGKSHYPFFKMLGLAWEGISSLSVSPLRLITFTGGLAAILTLAGCAYILLSLFFRKTAPGWASLETTIFFFGSVQLFSVGIVGEYIAKIYTETQHKPLYFVEEEI